MGIFGSDRWRRATSALGAVSVVVLVVDGVGAAGVVSTKRPKVASPPASTTSTRLTTSTSSSTTTSTPPTTIRSFPATPVGQYCKDVETINEDVNPDYSGATLPSVNTTLTDIRAQADTLGQPYLAALRDFVGASRSVSKSGVSGLQTEKDAIAVLNQRCIQVGVAIVDPIESFTTPTRTVLLACTDLQAFNDELNGTRTDSQSQIRATDYQLIAQGEASSVPLSTDISKFGRDSGAGETATWKGDLAKLDADCTHLGVPISYPYD